MTRRGRKVVAIEEAHHFIERGKRAEFVGASGEALGWYDRALASLTRHEATRELADALRWKGTVHRECGDIAEADRLYLQSAEVAREAGYDAGVAHAINCRGTAAQLRGNLDEAERLYRDAESRANASDDLRLSAMAQRNLGTIASLRGDIYRALDAFSAALRIAELLDDEDGQSTALNNIALAYVQSGRYAEATEYYARAIELAQRSGNQVVESFCRINRADMFVALSRLEEAELDCSLGVAIADRRGDRLRQAEGLKVRAAIARCRAQWERAEDLLLEAFDLTDTAEDVIIAAELRREMAELCHQNGRRIDATLLYGEARELFRRSGALASVTAIDAVMVGLM